MDSETDVCLMYTRGQDCVENLYIKLPEPEALIFKVVVYITSAFEYTVIFKTFL